MRESRRRIVIAIGAGALLAPLTPMAQQAGKVWRVGMLSPSDKSSVNSTHYEAFFQGMREQGFVEGKNLAYVWRFGDSKYERLPALAVELVLEKVDLVLAIGSASVRAARAATLEIPIVMTRVADPVTAGLVAAYARPGANVTGVTLTVDDLHGKYLDLLRQILPSASRVGVLANPGNPGNSIPIEQIRASARKLSVQLSHFEAATSPQLQNAFEAMRRARLDALIILLDAFFFNATRRIAELALANRVPAIFSSDVFANEGGLMSYGPSIDDDFHRAASFVGRILLKGAKPADLPIERPSRIYLTLNLKTAKAMGLVVPQILLLRTDRVIE